MRVRLNKLDISYEEAAKRGWLKLGHTYSQIRAAFYFCENCCTEFYAMWHGTNFWYKRDTWIDEEGMPEEAFNFYQSLKNEEQALFEKTLTIDIGGKRTTIKQDWSHTDKVKVNNELYDTPVRVTCPVCGKELASDKEPLVYMYYSTYYGRDIVRTIRSSSLGIYDDLTERFNIIRKPYKNAQGEMVQGSYDCSINCEDVDGIFEFMHRKRWELISDKVNGAVEQKCEEYEVEAKASEEIRYLNDAEAEKIKHDSGALKGFIKNILDIENSIYVLKQRLVRLLYFENDFKILERGLQFNEKKGDDPELIEQNKKLDRLINEIQRDYSYADFGMQELIPPTKPSEPEYKKPGLLNKKKVDEYNAHLRNQYDSDLAEYENRYKEYSEKERELQGELAAKVEATRQQKRDEAAKLQTEISNLKEQLIIRKKETFQAKYQMIENNKAEIDEVSKLLHDSILARQQYYGSGVIAQKYQDYVILCTIYDYLDTDRCSALGGADGAYNLYESENRQNIIIGQLSKVITQLEDIKDTQHKLYSEMVTANATLKKINNNSEIIAKSAVNIEKKTDELAQNTEAIAYYSKKTAELTNSLGYLMAFKM